MNQKVRLFLLFLVFILSTGEIFAQDEGSRWSIGTDLVSRYIWRGLNLGGSSPSIQPYLEYAFGTEDHLFTVGAWGAYSLSGTQTGQEADLYLSYTIKQLFSITLTDYFLPDEESSSFNYFNLNTDWDKIDSGDKEQTGHLLEAAFSFNGTENIPITLMLAVNIWGADNRKYENISGNMVPVDKIVMSKYLELGYSTNVNEVGIDLFAGMPLDFPDTDNGEPAGFYGQTQFGLINLGISLTRDIQMTDIFSLPVSVSMITNPEAGNIYMVFGISF
jgi:hypothetical protein